MWRMSRDAFLNSLTKVCCCLLSKGTLGLSTEEEGGGLFRFFFLSFSHVARWLVTNRRPMVTLALLRSGAGETLTGCGEEEEGEEGEGESAAVPAPPLPAAAAERATAATTAAGGRAFGRRRARAPRRS